MRTFVFLLKSRARSRSSSSGISSRTTQCLRGSRLQVVCSRAFSNGESDSSQNGEMDEDSDDYEEPEFEIGDDYVETPTLPCYLSKFDAIESFVFWSKRQSFAPKKFAKSPKSYIHSVSRFYVPFWHFEAAARSKYHACATADEKVFRNDKSYLWKQKDSSCFYSAAMDQMQVPASALLTADESSFLRIPFGETQFQRMHHEKMSADVLDIDVEEAAATSKVLQWLQLEEHSRMSRLVESDKMFNAKFSSEIQHNVRLCHMPCYLIHFSGSKRAATGDTFDKPHVYDTDIDLHKSRLRRAIVNGASGCVSGKRVVGKWKTTAICSAVSSLFIAPIGLLLLFPLPSVLTCVGLTGATVAAGIGYRMGGRRLTVSGNLMNTAQANYKRRALVDKEIEELIDSADRAWMGYSSRGKPVRRQHDFRREDTYRRFYGLDKEGSAGNYTHAGGFSAGARKYEFDYEAFDYEKAYGYKEAEFGKGSAKGKEQSAAGSGPRVVRHTALYKELNVSPKATHSEVLQSFSELAKQLHPDVLETKSEDDKKQGTDKFVRVLTAFQILKDPEKRRQYDETGKVTHKKRRKKQSTTTQQQTAADSHYGFDTDSKQTQKPKNPKTGTKRHEFNRGVGGRNS